MGNVHFLPARQNNVRLAANSAANDASSMSEQPIKSSQSKIPTATNSAAVFQLTDNKQRRYELLVQHYHADIFRYGFWLTKDREVAQELTQETFLRAWKNLDSLLDVNAAKAWLITILRRENARRFERKQFAYDDATEQDSLADTEQLSAEQNYDNLILRRHIAALAEEYREPLVLQALGGFSSDEIAQLLQLNVNTVNTRLFRARNMLRDNLNAQREPSHG